MDKIKYISPSTFYYWERCPFQAVLSKLPESKGFFPKHPDTDLGSLIHKFYEKKDKWNIDSFEKFNSKWNCEIDELNKSYLNNDLQKVFFPIQWHASYYAIKKLLLAKNLMIKKADTKIQDSEFQYLYEYWINSDVIGGRIDLLIKKNDTVTQIVDFKTGKIFEKHGNTIKLKEIYKQQMALYSSVILEKQDFLPELYLEQMDGKRVPVEVDLKYIKELKQRAKQLKNKINSAILNNTTDDLSVCNTENCNYCFYRQNCKPYKRTFINKRIVNKIDIYGKVSDIKPNAVTVVTKSENINIMNVEDIGRYKLNHNCEIYNLFWPDNNENKVFETINTVIKHEL